jgi:hypothetical protein
MTLQPKESTIRVFAAGATQAQPSGVELVSEVSDLAAGAGMLTFTLAPLALPCLALVALTAVALLLPVLAVALPFAPFMAAGRYWRSHDRSSAATRSAPSGDRDAGYQAPRGGLLLPGGPAA